MESFRICSDLHNEFNSGGAHKPVPELEGEQDMVLIIAGDLGVAEKEYTFLPLLSELSERHNQVIYFPGNHEHYHGSLMRTDEKITRAINREGLENVTYVGVEGSSRIEIGDTAVIAHPLYTDMFNMDPLVMMDVQQAMNDFRTIRTGSSGDPYKRKLNPKDYVALHMQGKELIFTEVERAHKDGYKTLVASHWGPSLRSVPERFKGSNINGAYVSDLDREIELFQPNVMVHGHTHDSFDYYINETRVICNPHGYVGTSDHNKRFDPHLVVTL